MKLFFTVEQQKLKRTNTEFIANNSRNYLECEFTFGTDWEDITDKYAVFHSDKGNTTVVIENNVALVPHDIIGHDDITSFIIGVFGTIPDKDISTNFVSVVIAKGAYLSEDEIGNPEEQQSLYQQAVDMMEEMEVEHDEIQSDLDDHEQRITDIENSGGAGTVYTAGVNVSDPATESIGGTVVKQQDVNREHTTNIKIHDQRLDIIDDTIAGILSDAQLVSQVAIEGGFAIPIGTNDLNLYDNRVATEHYDATKLDYVGALDKNALIMHERGDYTFSYYLDASHTSATASILTVRAIVDGITIGFVTDTIPGGDTTIHSFNNIFNYTNDNVDSIIEFEYEISTDTVTGYSSGMNAMLLADLGGGGGADTMPSSKVNVVHTHLATEVTQDPEHQFVNQAEKDLWNAGTGGGGGAWVSTAGVVSITAGSTAAVYMDGINFYAEL